MPALAWAAFGMATADSCSPSCPALRDGQNYAATLGMEVHPVVQQSVFEAMSARGQCTACFSAEDLAQYADWKRKKR